MLVTSDPILGRMQNHFEEYGLNSSIVEKKIFRIYEIKNNDIVWFEISEEIRLDHLSSIQKEFSLEN